jgi:transcriptional regulator GlxA family with amidase domain
VDLFKKQFPEVILKSEMMITDQGRLLCGGGAHSYFDLCLYLVERYCGFDVAVQCSKSLLLDMGRCSQTPYALFEFQKRHGDKNILRAQNWIEKNFSKSISVEQMAYQARMSLRTFKRRFKKVVGDTPLIHLQRFRIEVSKRALEKSKEGVEEISFSVGYSDPTFFRQLFKRYLSMTPNEYRKKFPMSTMQEIKN